MKASRIEPQRILIIPQKAYSTFTKNEQKVSLKNYLFPQIEKTQISTCIW